MKISIDKNAGFCPGVRNAIRKADKHLEEEGSFACLGSLLHNDLEMGRLGENGLRIVKHSDFPELSGKKVLFRAHGEPPETYELAGKYDVDVVDATCAVVRKLQVQVSEAAEEMQKINGQVVIFGKKDHPEVIGLLGNSNGQGILVSAMQDLGKVDMKRPIRLFSQTTMDEKAFGMIALAIHEQHNAMSANPDLIVNNTICSYVLNRVPSLKEFASNQEVVIFVSGRESSNGQKLFMECKAINPETYFISDPTELLPAWIEGKEMIGISGSASTPQWLMEKVAEKIETII